MENYTFILASSNKEKNQNYQYHIEREEKIWRVDTKLLIFTLYCIWLLVYM